MTASRSFASNFTNSSTKTIFIILDIYFGNSSGVTITVNGITFTQGSTNNEHRVFSFPVLPGGVYRADIVAGSATLAKWIDVK